jgi:hypothetical protein
LRYSVAMDPLGRLDEATSRYRKTETAHEHAREATIAAALDALRAGERPTDVVGRSPFTAAYIRRLARQAGIEGARPGPKTKETPDA